MRFYSNYIKGDELIQEYDLKLFELFNIIKCGDLTPYDHFGKIAPHPFYADPVEADIRHWEMVRFH